MNKELKPVRCGCGGEAEVRGFENLDDSVSIYVCCSKCHTSTVSFTGDQAEANAVEAWNTAMSATDTNVGDKIIYCKDCKYSHMTIDGLCKYCDIWFPNERMYLDGKFFCASAEKRML